MIVFLAKITNRANVDKVLNNETFIHEDIYNFEADIHVGTPVFLVFSGDKSKIDWSQGLVGVGIIEKSPYDKGYSAKNARYFRISIKPVFVLKKTLEPKFTKLHPEYQNELYEVPYVGANHFPNQAIAKASGNGALALFGLLKEFDTENKLSFFKDFISEHYGSDDLKNEFRTYLLKKNETSTVSSYINSLDNLSKFLTSSNIPSNFKWDRNIDIDKLKITANFVRDESKKEKGGILEKYKPKSHWNNGWYYSGINNFISFIDQIPEPHISNEVFNIANFQASIIESGLLFNKSTIVRFVSSLMCKNFVILTGLSGSGKTKLAQAFVKWISRDETQYKLIPVGADWTNREPLLGFPNALETDKYVKPENGALDLILRAIDKSDVPHFLILDEMNLSHVERYFADFLSAMESQEEIPLYSGNLIEGLPKTIPLPNNLFVIGTVNIDETTYMFSPKVLDRANTIEFRIDTSDIESYLETECSVDLKLLDGVGASMGSSFLEMTKKKYTAETNEEINNHLVEFFQELKKARAEFGYRSAGGFLKLVNCLGVNDRSMSENQKLDIAIMQKLLPKLHGSRRKLCPILLKLASFCVSDTITNIERDVFDQVEFDFTDGSRVKFPLSLEKITRMYKGALDNGFASYAEA